MRMTISHFVVLITWLLAAMPISASEKNTSLKKANPGPHAAHKADQNKDKDPTFLASVNPENRACKNKIPSSIDISAHGIKLDANSEVKIDFQVTNIEMQSRSFTQTELADTENLVDTVTLKGSKYTLSKFHFHTPSEHIVNGKRFPMELQLVHKSKNGKLAVLVLLFEADKSTPAETPQAEQPLVADIAKLLAQDNTVYTYTSSLTTPPCTKNVSWIVLQQPIAMSPANIVDFQEILHKKNGPRHQSYRRKITQSQ
jgi:carbonic anhydrase